MSAVYLYDDACARTFEPFALTRPAGELRAGALLVRDRWAHALGATVAGHITSAHLAGFDEPGAPPVVSAGENRAFANQLPFGSMPALTTGGAPGSSNPARCADVICPATVAPSACAHRSRTSSAPARISPAGRVSANGSNVLAHASSYR